jgi:predicted GTPase
MSIDNVQKLILVSPVNAATPTTDASFAARLTELRGKRVGLVDNSKSRAGQFLDAVTSILDQQYGFSNIVCHRKPSASKPVAPEVIAEFAKICDLVITGVGD